jgi:pimeloyl-ACP methyl ester carboxylesterase
MASALHHVILTAPGAAPARFLIFLHGILGSGGNWRSFARRLISALPSWGAVLVDLRLHGASQGPPPPHTLAAAAADLHGVTAGLPGPVGGVLGHSFGGKVALAWLRSAPLREPGQIFLIDSTPSARPDARGSEEVLRVLAALRGLPGPFPTRDAFIGALVERGHERALAQWLAMNLRPEPRPGGLRLAVDLDGIEAMLADYFAADLWPVICPPPEGVVAHLVVGGRSAVVSEEDRLRAAGCGERLRVHVLPAAGHFVHVDDPDGLFALVSAALAPAGAETPAPQQ